MTEARTAAVAIQPEPARPWAIGVFQAVGAGLGRTGMWAVDTAQKFGTLVSVLMGPAVFSAYAFAFWCLAANLGWTDTFPYTSGPLSNWLMWLGISVMVHLAAGVLTRRTSTDREMGR
jgi:hypothetical protein